MTALNLHEYQKTAIKFGLQQGAAGFFLDLGLGKSVIALTIFKILRDKGLARRALVLAPLRPAQTVWRQEAARWDEFSGLNVKLLHGKDRNPATVLDSDISVGNLEALPQIFDLAKGMKPWPWDVLICDESGRLKGYNTVRFKTLKAHLAKFHRRYILTATPAPQSLMDLFSQMYILDQGASLGKFITQYRNRFFVPDYMGWNWTLKPGAEAEIHAAIKPLVLRMDAKDLLELPPLTYRTVDVELPAAARRAYHQLEVDLLTEIQGNTVVATNAASATSKLRQVANGSVYYEKDGDRKTQVLHEEKVEALAELVESAQGKPLLVAYEYQSDLEALLRKFPGTPHIGGGTTAAQVDEYLAKWRAGSLPLLFVQPASFAYGTNGQCPGAGIVWFSLPWNLDWYTQLIGRLHRQGQTTPVIVHHLAVKDTVDTTVLRVLSSKAKTQSALLDALKEDLTHPA